MQQVLNQGKTLAAPVNQPHIGQRLWGAVKRGGIGWIVPISIVILWQILVEVGVIPERLLPRPTQIVAAAWKLTESGDLATHIGISTQRAVIGLAIGGGLGFLLGLINGVFTLSEKLLDSTFQMIRTIPNLALVPLVILWFGIGEPARIFLISVGVFFPVYLNTFHGVRSVDPHLIEMGRVYGLGRLAMFREVILPGALPSILVGLRFALGIMWLTLIVSETIAARTGIGHMTSQAREFMQTDIMVFSIVLYALLGKLADVIARGLERGLLGWNPNYRSR
ncbi:MAG: ABC transporter permease subunit [Anaerolineae bacterium]|jgi:sulfonate transport system permease protein|nr:ABC transporter permease subunit [Anaerolineae bacterium]